MKKFIKEFKELALKGNMIDLAIGMIIGAAFTSVVSSLVNDIFMPLIGAIVGGTDFGSGLAVTVGESVINFGAFITALVNFLLMALVVFFFVKAVNKIRTGLSKKEEPAAPTTKKCPYCKSEIAIDATRCPHCTSELDK